jgi:hypothetical protein
MTTVWVDRYRTECGSCDNRVEDWLTVTQCNHCGTTFSKIGTHFINDQAHIRQIIQARPDLEWAGVHPEKWNH